MPYKFRSFPPLTNRTLRLNILLRLELLFLPVFQNKREICMKKLKIAAALVLVVAGLSFAGCDLLNQPLDKEVVEKVGNEIKRNKQEIITLGMYPQSEKSGKVTIGSEETVKVNGWDCYIGSDGEKYVKLDVENFDTNEIETKYFKIEPLKWRVLTNNYKGTGKKLLFCEKLIDCCEYMESECPDTRKIWDQTIYSNNYFHSRIRAFLNGLSYETEAYAPQVFSYQWKRNTDFQGKGFFQLAFNDEEKVRIATTAVDNSDGVPAKYKCDDTMDKIFLLSKKEIENTAYGFASEDDELDYISRAREATDFAHARGVSTFYHLRTPKTQDNEPTNWLVGNVKIESKDANGKDIVIDYRGKLADWFMSMNTGVVPALCLNNDIPDVLTSSEVIDIYYPARDYTKDEEDLTEEDYYIKHANVYLPVGYDKNDTSTKYPLLLMIHGMGCNENTWGLQNPGSELKTFIDDGIASGNITKCIIVSANGIADKTWGPEGNGNSITGANAFGEELRNNILPYLRENFNILEGRENVALAGFSMGGEQTMNIGLGECLDLISYFGTFGACPHAQMGNPESDTLDPAIFTSNVENRFSDEELTIKHLYIAIGEKDDQFRPTCEAYIQAMPDWDRVEQFDSDIVEGKAHEWLTWLFGIEHFLPLVFK